MDKEITAGRERERWRTLVDKEITAGREREREVEDVSGQRNTSCGR